MPILPTDRLVKFLALLCGSGALLCLLLFPLNSQAAFTKQINYQGKLTNASGVAVADGSYSIVFTLYDALSGGSTVWTETDTVTTTGGLFSLMLGTVSSLDDVNFNQALYLTLNVNGDGEMSPRKVLGAVPSSFTSARLDGNASSTAIDVSGYLYVSGDTSLATTTATRLEVGDPTLVSVSDPFGRTISSFGGISTFLNSINSDSDWIDVGGSAYLAVGSQVNTNYVNSSWSTPADTTYFWGNFNSTYYSGTNLDIDSAQSNLLSSTIDSGVTLTTASGLVNIGSSLTNSGSVTGDLINLNLVNSGFGGALSGDFYALKITGISSMGGAHNYAIYSDGGDSYLNGDLEVTGDLITGGSTNPGDENTIISSGSSQFILGGYANTILGTGSGIVGGFNNYASSSSLGGAFIFGGSHNNAFGGAIIGASISTTTGQGVILGGSGNELGEGTTNGVIVGGSNNLSLAAHGGIFSGENNFASGSRAVVIGGLENQAMGAYSGTYSGQDNVASGTQSSILGGISNTVGTAGLNSVVLGGKFSTVTGQNAAILGGESNLVSGDHSASLDGYNNQVIGDYSYAMGGRNNVINENYSYAFGENLTINSSNSFGINLGSTAYTIDQIWTMAIMGGRVGIGTTTPVSTLSVQGSLCVRDTGSCGMTDGTIYATTASITDIDIAENYFAFENGLSAGYLVSLSTVDLTGFTNRDESFGVKKATANSPILGVVSTAPGLLLGKEKQGSVPVALSGRVPVKVNLENGPILPGDYITLSSTPGVGTKALSSGQSIGIALEKYDPSSPQENGLGQIMVFVNLGYAQLSSSINSGAINTGGELWAIDGLTGKIKSTSSLDLGNFDLANVRSITSASGAWGLDVNGELKVSKLTANELSIEQGVTVKDRATGDLTCVYVERGAIQISFGKCSEREPVPGISIIDDNPGEEEVVASTTNSEISNETVNGNTLPEGEEDVTSETSVTEEKTILSPENVPLSEG